VDNLFLFDLTARYAPSAVAGAEIVPHRRAGRATLAWWQS